MHPVHPLKHILSSSTQVSSAMAVEGRFELGAACKQLGEFIIELNHTQAKNEGEISKANPCSKNLTI
jgi:hypothetical protein